MYIDLLLPVFGIGSFICFIILLGYLIRARGQMMILSSMKQAFIIILIISSLGIWAVFYSLPILTLIMIIFVHLLLFFALSFAYIIGLLGLPITSMRIQLLILVFLKGEKGIQASTLANYYSKENIIRNRLFRLVTSRELIKHGNYYILRSRLSYFMLHTYFLNLLNILYDPIQPNRSLKKNI